MRYFCLCCDYDGTLAHDGSVAPSTIAALKRVAASGRKLVLATGRELNDLLQVFPELTIFDRVVAENGAVLYRPAERDQKILAEPPPPAFVEELHRRGVRRFPLEAASLPPGTPTKRPFWTPFVHSAWACRSRSTKAR